MQSMQHSISVSCLWSCRSCHTERIERTIIGILKKAAKNSNIIIFLWDSRMAMLIIYRSANDIALSFNIYQIANPMETHSTLSTQSCL